MVTVIPLRLDAFTTKSGTFPTALPVQHEERMASAKQKPFNRKIKEDLRLLGVKMHGWSSGSGLRPQLGKFFS